MATMVSLLPRDIAGPLCVALTRMDEIPTRHAGRVTASGESSDEPNNASH